MSKKLIISIKILLLGLVLIVVGVLLFKPQPVNHFSLQNSLQKGEEIMLPQPRFQSNISIEETILKRRSVREYKDEPLNLQEVSQLLWATQGITGAGGFRAAPSAGALYPLKVYVMGQIEGLAIGIYQYNPHNHSLIIKPLRSKGEGGEETLVSSTKKGDKDLREELVKAAYGQTWIGKAPVNIIFTGNYEIIAQKYGKEKAPRYTHMEVGHAAQNVYLQAESLNLGTVAMGGFEIEKVKKILSLPAEEEPLYIMPVGRKVD